MVLLNIRSYTIITPMCLEVLGYISLERDFIIKGE